MGEDVWDNWQKVYVSVKPSEEDGEETKETSTVKVHPKIVIIKDFARIRGIVEAQWTKNGFDIEEKLDHDEADEFVQEALKGLRALETNYSEAIFKQLWAKKFYLSLDEMVLFLSKFLDAFTGIGH